jgi:hypothetical protein
LLRRLVRARGSRQHLGRDRGLRRRRDPQMRRVTAVQFSGKLPAFGLLDLHAHGERRLSVGAQQVRGTRGQRDQPAGALRPAVVNPNQHLPASLQIRHPHDGRYLQGAVRGDKQAGVVEFAIGGQARMRTDHRGDAGFVVFELRVWIAPHTARLVRLPDDVMHCRAGLWGSLAEIMATGHHRADQGQQQKCFQAVTRSPIKPTEIQ